MNKKRLSQNEMEEKYRNRRDTIKSYVILLIFFNSELKTYGTLPCQKSR